MKRLILISALCFAAILIGAVYTLVDGIKCGSALGVTLSVTCIVTLFASLQFLKKLLAAPAEEEHI